MKVTLPVTLDSERDRDILAALAGERNRSAAVRQALREHYSGGHTVTLADILRELQAIPKGGCALRRAGVVAAPGAGPAPDEPADLAEALNSLGT